MERRYIRAMVESMRTAIARDEKLVAKAQEYTGIEGKAALVREALAALIQREAARRLARLGRAHYIAARDCIREFAGVTANRVRPK